MALLTIQPPA